MDKAVNVPVPHMTDESRRWLDETLAEMRQDHQKTLALMRELHAEKIWWLDRLLKQRKQRSATSQRRRKR